MINQRERLAQNWIFIVLVLFLVVVLTSGGSSRDDVQPLAGLRPLSVILCGVALVGFDIKDTEGRLWPIVGFSVMFSLATLYLVPLPPAIRHAISSNGLLTTIDQMADLDGAWRPLAIAPTSAANSIFSLFVPAAVLMLTLRLSRKKLLQLPNVFLAFGVVSVVVGILQLLGPPDNSLYFYNITNGSAPVGLFANRNHASLMFALIFPIMTFVVINYSKPLHRINQWLMIFLLSGVILVPLLLINGSRSGLIIALLSLTGSTIIFALSYTSSKINRGRVKPITFIFASIALATAGLVLLFYIFSRALAIERLFQAKLVSDNRSDFWPATLEVVFRFLPLGTGPGGFAKAYEVHEPLDLLDSSYLNRAHNDWIEAVVQMGVAGLVMLIVALVFFAFRHIRSCNRDNGIGESTALSQLGSIIIFLIAASSFADYPIRTPYLMCLFVVATIWVSNKKVADGNHNCHNMK